MWSQARSILAGICSDPDLLILKLQGSNQKLLLASRRIGDKSLFEPKVTQVPDWYLCQEAPLALPKVMSLEDRLN